jgi:hypothetical protein
MTLPVFGRGLVVAGGLAAALLVGTYARDARACGCFTPPDPSVPVVQAGERILFAMDGGSVVAHIQIQYAGSAQEFGWLLPLPSVPTLELGTDELFNSLITATQPKYRLVSSFEGTCGFGQQGRGILAPTAGGDASGAGGNSGGMSPLVIQDSIGPFDYAVLKADNKDEMLAWMAENRYFVPAGTDATVINYIHTGAFFLALKLRSGQSAGDLQPVVVRYPSELPMIPIVLTSVAAQPNMGVQVWMLGAGRAIPRNYYHTVINDLAIDWANSGRNYNDVIIEAVGQAPFKHSFVTEYAGPSTIMQKVLNAPGRFGTTAELAASPDAGSFMNYLQTHGFAFTSQLTTILGRYIPYPPGLAAQNITPTLFYQNYAYYTGAYRQSNPAAFADWPAINYQPAAMAQEIEERVVKPTLDAGALFDKYPALTRLYTTLSPEDMTKDPVFSFNPTLPNISNEHNATITYYCGSGSNDRTRTPARLVTEQGWTVDFPTGTGQITGLVPPPPTGLTVRRLEILSEEGPPQVVKDNPPSNGCGCAFGGGAGVLGAAPAGGIALLAGAALLGLTRRRRRSHRA